MANTASAVRMIVLILTYTIDPISADVWCRFCWL